MAAKCYILIETAVGKSNQVIESVGKVQGVTSVDEVTGIYDVIVVVEGNSLPEIGRFALDKIRPISGITKTVTCLVI